MKGKWRFPGAIFAVMMAGGGALGLGGSAGPSGADLARLQQSRFDLVVVGATPGGIAFAVRAAREGLAVLLVNHNQHLGGILSSGLAVWDTLHEGKRAPLYDEVRQAIFDHYRTTYGADSPQYQAALPGKSGHTNGRFEARVAEKILTALVEREARVTVLKGFVPTRVERLGRMVRTVTFREKKGEQSVDVAAPAFADCTYEGDLAALAKVPYRVGREARTEFNEPHAGQVFLRPVEKPPGPAEATLAKEHGLLNLRKFTGWQQILKADSSGAADLAVQAFNYRTMLCSDPDNRILPGKPKDYDPEQVRKLEYGSIVGPLPNRKIGWNRPQLVGVQHDYVEGDWAKRQQVMDRHWQATLALLFFLQNDPSVPEDKKSYWNQFGLAKDEFADHGHRPYEIYVREARRIVGRQVFTQHDAMLAPGIRRAPIQTDSIAVTEWYMDTHAVQPVRVPGSSFMEGKMMLHHETWPGQISYRCLLPRDLDNLLVPVCLSSTHVAWGTVRLEPTWMNLAESAGHAVALAKKQGKTPAEIDPRELLRLLAERRVMLAFFNDVDLASRATWVPAVQYLATKGFFPTYNARPDQPLDIGVARHWARMLNLLIAGKLAPSPEARTLYLLEDAKAGSTTVAVFAELIRAELKGEKGIARQIEDALKDQGLKSSNPLTRAQACELMFRIASY